MVEKVSMTEENGKHVKKAIKGVISVLTRHCDFPGGLNYMEEICINFAD